jgi:predicted RNA-binding protein
MFIKGIYYYEQQNITYTVRRCATKNPKKGIYKKRPKEKSVIERRQSGQPESHGQLKEK